MSVGASEGNRTLAVCLASRSTNRYTTPAYRCKKIVQPSYGHHPRVSGSLLTNISSLCSKNIGADSPIRTDVDFRLVVTNHVQSTTMRYRHIISMPILRQNKP